MKNVKIKLSIPKLLFGITIFFCLLYIVRLKNEIHAYGVERQLLQVTIKYQQDTANYFKDCMARDIVCSWEYDPPSFEPKEDPIFID